jgi:hypothetical protein
MGRRYLKYTDRKPGRLRHLKRSWTHSGVPAVAQNAPICNEAYPITGANNPWRIEVIGPTPNWVTSWAITIQQKVISTGVAGTAISVAFTVIANQTPAQVATAIAAALDANAAVVCAAPAAGQAQCQMTLADTLNAITSVFIGASSNAAPVQALSDEPEPEVAMAAPVVEKKSKKKA